MPTLNLYLYKLCPPHKYSNRINVLAKELSIDPKYTGSYFHMGMTCFYGAWDLVTVEKLGWVA